MLDFLKGDKDDKQTKATDRSGYMQASLPAWEKVGHSVQRSKNYAALMQHFNGWVYAAAMCNARAVSAQTIRLYSKKPQRGAKSLAPTRSVGTTKTAYLQGKMENKPSTYVKRKSMDGEIVEVMDHPVLELLENPSPEMDGYTLTMLRMLNLQLTGNSYLHPIMSETISVPVELWSMPSHLVKIIPDGEFDMVSSYEYGQLPNVTTFNKDEVLHERQPNPTDMLYGRGWVEAAISAIDLLDSMDQYEQNVLDNQARPDWAVMVKEHLTDTQYQRLYQQIEKRLGGKNNRSRPFIFEGGIDGKSMQFSPQDLQFASGENRKVEVIAAISGVPVSMLKANDPNLASAREGSMGHLRNTIVPYLSLDEGFLNRQLLPMFGIFADDLFLAYDDPIQEDKLQDSQINSSNIQAGILTRNEVRESLGLENVEGGDTLFVPAGSVPIELAIDPPEQMPYGMFNTTAAPKAEAERPIEEAVVGATEAELIGQPLQVDAMAALNGAQVTAALEIVKLVSQGQMPREAAVGQLSVFFNLTEEQAEQILGDVGRGFVPEPMPTEIVETLAKAPPSSPNPVQQPSKPSAGGNGDDRDRGGYDDSAPAPQPENGTCPDGWHYMPADDLHDKPFCMLGSTHPISADSMSKASDCVSEKIPKLLEEGYDQEQAAAIAYSMCNDEKSNDKDCGCDSKKKIVSGKKLWEEALSMVGTKRAPVDNENEDFKERMRDYSKWLDNMRDGAEEIIRSEIERFLDGGLVVDSFLPAATEQAIRDVTTEFVEGVTAQAGQGEYDYLDIGIFNPDTPEVRQYLEEQAESIVRTLSEGTRNEVRDKIELGVRHGQGSDEIARDIRSLIEKEPKTGKIPVHMRAEMIARTEIAMIIEGARLEAWKQSDVIDRKRWQVSAGACDSCRDMARLQPDPIPLDEPFAGKGSNPKGAEYLVVGKVRVWSPLGGDGGALMTAPLHPNCRCGTIQVLTDQTEEELEAMRDIANEAALEGIERKIDQWIRDYEGEINPTTGRADPHDLQMNPFPPRALIEQWVAELGLGEDWGSDKLAEMRRRIGQ